MAIEFQCPKCGAQLRVPDAAAGKRGGCPQCQTKLIVPIPQIAVAPPVTDEGNPFAATEPEPSPFAPAPVPAATPSLADLFAAAASPAPPAYPAAAPLFPPASVSAPAPLPNVASPPTPFAAPDLFAAAPASSVDIPGMPALPTPPAISGMPPLPDSIAGPVSAPVASPPPAMPPLDPLAQLAAPPPAAAPARRPTLRRKKRRGFVPPTWMVAVVCLSLLSAFGYSFYVRAQPKIAGTTPGEALSQSSIGPFEIDLNLIDIGTEELGPVLEHLDQYPWRVDSQVIRMQFVKSPRGIGVQYDTPSGHQFYRFDPARHGALREFVLLKRADYEDPRKLSLIETLPKWIEALKKRASVEERSTPDPKAIERGVEFRNKVGMAASTRGISFHLEALLNKEVYRCLAEDGEGRFYFCLPIGTKSYKLRMRSLTGAKPAFDSSLTVNVTKTVDDSPAEEKSPPSSKSNTTPKPTEKPAPADTSANSSASDSTK